MMKNIYEKIMEFRDQRDWKQYHDEKDLAISISLEANELLENFQWKSSEEALATSRQNIKEEMADVFIYLIQMADKMDVNLEEEVIQKLEKNAKKYPVSQEREGDIK
ncbi:TPA: nucleotide pyrophosphohydrolase [Bacillus tropicus]|nr:nucleotide pyrophosphohydrolase [Bacillus tropicus]KDB41354.1 nucleotide pyrophosphohydrolase [Bacillus cereus]QPS53322.1 nucleotide pyrophosphohydrolase [Bacillus tropicus]